MSKGISQDDYDAQLEELSTRLAEWAEQDVERDTAYDDHHSAVIDLASDVLDGANWFARSYHGPADHGAIIEYAEGADVDPGIYGDLSVYTDSDDPATVVKRLAYAMFEAHVIERATERVGDD